MLQLVGKLIPPFWAAFLVFCICLGFLADVFTAWSLLGSHADKASSVLPTLVVYLVIGVAVFSGGCLVAWVFRNTPRLKRGRRDADKFKALAPDIGKLRDNVRQALEEYRASGYSPAVAEVVGTSLAEAAMLTHRLEELGIPERDEDDDSSDDGEALLRLVVTYLSALEKAAVNGDLSLARSTTFSEMFRDLP